ncbi:MAG TPA: pitrilysin family protein [Thermoanaerobaculia bacterium]|nr:pitrilysin family protein [Thermoanaerobaculia bacterium]
MPRAKLCGGGLTTFALVTLVFASGVAAQVPERPQDLRFPPRVVTIPDAAGVRHALKNGIPVFVAEDHSLPLVQIHLAVAAGDFQDPPDRVGLAGLTGAMLRRGGAGAWNADAFDARADLLGAELDSIGANTRSGVSLDCSSRVLADALPLFAAMVRAPRFDATRFERARANLRESLARREDDPLDVLDREWGFLLLGPDHFTTREVQPASLAAMTRDDLVAFHRENWRPSRMVIAVSGDVDAKAVVAALDALLGDWRDATAPGEAARLGSAAAATTSDATPRVHTTPGKMSDATSRARIAVAGAASNAGLLPALEPADLPPPPAAGLYLRHWPGPQAKIALGHRGPLRRGWDDPDEPALLVLAEVLGGDGAVSRLRRTLRAEEGLAYRARARLTLGLQAPGTFQVFLETAPAHAARALELARRELILLREEPVPEVELGLAKRSLLDLVPLLFDSAERRAGRAAEDVLLGRPHDYWQRYRDRIGAVTARDVQSAARRHIRPDDLIAVVVGDREALLDGARADRVDIAHLLGPLHELPRRDPLTLAPLAAP